MASFLLELAGAVALLLWSVRLVRTGVERGFSVQLRLWLRRSSGNAAMSLGTGLIASVLMQSSTAVAILTAGFVTSGTLAAAVGLSVLLGADVGSALVTKLLLASPAWVIPALLVPGVTLFLRGKLKNTRQIGRILIGLALIFVALGMIRAATEPLKDFAGLSAVLAYLGNDVVTAFVVGAIFAWAVHSSVAAVLLVATLATHGELPLAGAMALILGANFGGAMIGVILTLSSPPAARRVILANAILRGGGAAAFLTIITFAQPGLQWLGANAGQQAINLHIVFNLVIAALGQITRHQVLKLSGLLVPPETPVATELERISALDDTLLDRPDRALGCATREILYIGEVVETMLASVIRLFQSWDDTTAAMIAEREKRVNAMHFRTKVFLAKIHGATSADETTQNSMDLAMILANLEAAGDVVIKNLVSMARRLNSEKLHFSEDGWADLTDFHDRVLSNAQLALNVLLTGDPDAARQLIEEKERVREVEAELQTSHIDRLRTEKSEILATSNMHQEFLRSLKQINSAFSMIAQPILSHSGDLLSSRLTDHGPVK